ncbi:DinB family protein [Litchfieldia salsa]|uniref:DinB superfamily protein n=1 Tax=Litchfieldia salsa TaxID=930152 RepID=A0A1H0PMC5_9BACI|nr:DinB family protein [Litchfieldia salsa]SDP05940.1 DinB superfamily protein [Litchfieldia salsa]
MELLIEQYKQGYSMILKEIEGLTEEQFLFKPSEKDWSIREIIIHISDAELVHIHRMKAVLSENNPVLTAFDQDLWTTRLKSQQVDHQLYLELFKTMRESFQPILLQLTDQDYLRIGTHNQDGQLTFKEIFEHSIEHIDTHIGQIRRVKSLFR